MKVVAFMCFFSEHSGILIMINNQLRSVCVEGFGVFLGIFVFLLI